VLVRPDHQRVAFPQIHAILKVSLDRLLGLRFLSLLESWRHSALRLVVSLEYSNVTLHSTRLDNSTRLDTSRLDDSRFDNT
jgi:hypothetical protein